MRDVISPHLEEIRATRDDFDPQRSDIDLLMEFAARTDLDPWMSRFVEFQERLETLLQRNVDLVMAKGVQNPYLLRSIERDRQVLYAA